LLDPVLRRLNDLQRALDADRVTLASLPEAVSELWQAEDGTWRVDIAPKGSLDSDAALVAFVAGVRTRVPDVTGMAVNVVEADRMVVESLRTAFSIAAVSIALLLFALWGRVGDTLRALAPIAMAALWILGGAAWLGMPLNFANVIVLPLILGIGIDSGVHLVERHRRHHGRGVDLLGTSTARAILLSCVTTVASFGSLALSPHPGMASMGKLLVIGVVCTLLANLVVLPALLSFAEVRGEKSGAPPRPLPVPSSVPQR
jgi:predicted RND superfamily exporter protein